MNVTTWRDARLQLVRDTLLAVGQRMGHLDVQRINALPRVTFEDGWVITVSATTGFGQRIARLVDCTMIDPEGGDWRFSFDVLGANQTKNCMFSGGIDVNKLSEDKFNDLCLLPELFGDYVAGLLVDHFIIKNERSH